MNSVHTYRLQRLRRLFQSLSGFYAGGFAFWLLLWRFFGDANGWLALSNAWAFWLLLTGIPAGAIALAPRSLWLAGGWVVAIGFGFVHLYHPLLQPTKTGTAHRPLPNTQSDQLVILSVNMLNVPRNLSDSIAAILDRDPDLILFQEAITSHVEQLDSQLADAYPYRCWIPYLATDMGLGVASRRPFAVSGFWQDVGLEPYALRIALALPRGPLDIYCIHFISPSHQIRRYGPTTLLHAREQQISTILEEIARSERPAVVAGDWNSTEGADSYRWTSAQLVDGWLEGGVGPGWSWPRTLKGCAGHSFTPLLRLDYLFHTGGTKCRQVHVDSMQVITDERIGSDHCPLLAHLSVAPEPRHGDIL